MPEETECRGNSVPMRFNAETHKSQKDQKETVGSKTLTLYCVSLLYINRESNSGGMF